MENVFWEGFLIQASLIFALGSQNIFIIEQGILGRHPFFVSFICFFCDLILIQIGVAGMGILILSIPKLKIALGIVSSVLLMFYSLNRIRIEKVVLPAYARDVRSSIGKVMILAIIFSWFNPHAYIDAFLLIGSYSAKYMSEKEKIIFGLGAGIFSLVWFISLSYIARFFSSFLTRMLWVLNLGSALVFLYLSFKLSMDVRQWVLDLKHPPNSTYKTQ